MFALQRAGGFVQARGVRVVLPDVSAANVEARQRAFFGSAMEDAPAVLVGALPFDRAGPALLVQPDRFVRDARGSPFDHPASARTARRWVPLRIVADPDPAAYAGIVERALAMIARGALDKVVLARALHVDTSDPVDAVALAARLAGDPDVATFLVDLSPASGIAGHRLIGATPELLVSRHGSNVRSHPLAGSAARSDDAAADHAAGQALLSSAKDRREHAVVVEFILDTLAPHCARLSTPDGPALYATNTMWHLGTRIEGVLRDDAPSAVGLAALLHPTPAVGGAPRDGAIDLIHRLEPHGRGFYAGAVGWSDAAGDGEWHVTLRCAELRGTRVTLHAGAGIVAGSDPQAEVAETSAKFGAMLRALDLEEPGSAVEAVA